MHSYFIAKIRTTFNFHRNIARHHARAQMQTKDFVYCAIDCEKQQSLKVNITSASVVLWISYFISQGKMKKCCESLPLKDSMHIAFMLPPLPVLKCISITDIKKPTVCDRKVVQVGLWEQYVSRLHTFTCYQCPPFVNLRKHNVKGLGGTESFERFL